MAVVMTGCGGGGGGATFPLPLSPAPPPPAGDAPPPAPAPIPEPPSPPPPPPPAPTTLAVSVVSLALSVNSPATNAALTGNPRTITVTNTGSADAADVNLTFASSLPAGTTVSPTRCGLIHAGGTCVLTVTPGVVPSAAPGDLSAAPILMSVTGTNTNTVEAAIQIIGYGSVYQSGYLFSVNDATPSTGSIGGKVASLSKTSLLAYGGDGTAIGATAQSMTDGPSNTAAIVGRLGSGGPNYAARACVERNVGGYSDWYLPAICEIGTSAAGLCQGLMQQNIQDNLVEIGIGNTSTYSWSSTEDASVPQSQVYEQFSRSRPLGGFSTSAPKMFVLPSYCVRSTSY